MLRKQSLPNLFVRVALFTFGCCIGFFLIFWLHNLFRFQTVKVNGIPDKERALIVSLTKNQPSVFFDIEKYKKTLHSRIPALENITVNIYYPDKIVVTGHLASPVAYLASDEGYFTLSGSGMILEKKRTNKVPVPRINLYQAVHHNAYQAGQSITYSSIKKTLQFVQLLHSEGYSVERVDIDSVDVIACKVAGVSILFSQTKSIETQRHEFRQIAKQMKIGALRIVRLDLRFSKPVVELQK